MVGDESSGSAPELELVTTLTKEMKLDHPVNFGRSDYEIPDAMKFEFDFRNIMKRRHQMDQIRNSILLGEDSSHSNGMIVDEEEERKMIQALGQSGIISLLQGNPKSAVSKLQGVFDQISKFPSTVYKNPKDYVWVKYAYFCSLIEENTYSDLLHALKLLQELEKSLLPEEPIYHYAMAKLLLKFNRFRLAENEIKLCQDSMKGHQFTTYHWPGTELVIKETTLSGLLECLNGLLAKCGSYHKPDAVCKFAGCIEASSHPFPSRDIFKNEPDFKGYVILTCQEECKIQYHPLCWKKVKDAFSSVDKLSDKDCLGRPCVTPDCKSGDNEPSVIHKIEIIGSDGNVKSQCVPDHVSENKQKEIALSKKRLRQKSDEHKTEKQNTKSKPRQKKSLQLNHAQSSEDIAMPMKSPSPKENNSLQISGFIQGKANPPVKKENAKVAEKVIDEATKKDFICSYFHMLLTKKGPLSRRKFEEEWEKFYPNIQPSYNSVPEKDCVFNFLKNSPYTSVIDDYLYAREPSSPLSVESEHINAFSSIKAGTTNSVVDNKPDNSEENAHILMKMREIVKEISDKSADVKSLEREKKQLTDTLFNRDMNVNSLFSRDMNVVGHSASWLGSMQSASQSIDPPPETQREALLGKDVATNNSNLNPMGQQSKAFSFGYFDDMKSDNSPFNSSVREMNKLPASATKIPESGIALESAPVREEFRALTPPVRWRDDVFDMRFPSQVSSGPSKPNMKEQFEPQEILIRKDGFCQTDPVPESKNDDHDELWVQHMQMAVNDLLKKNKELVKSKEKMESAHKSEMEALSNQIQTLSNSYAEQIRVLKDNQSRNFDEDRRMMAMEARIKVQEEILHSTREELRKKDFDLLDAKKYLGIAILERLERESNRQVQRLVTALAALPCNGEDSEAVGHAMARWESAGNQASKAKKIFLEQCAICQAVLYEGYGSDSFQKLIIPIIEEPVGQCPLDKLAIDLLNEKDRAGSNYGRMHSGPSHERMSPYRMRPGNVVGGPHHSPSHSYSYPSHVSISHSPVSFGARPKETPPATNGETSEVLQSWPSTTSIPNSTKSSSTGNAVALTCSKKLFAELKRAYPSRTDDELWYAVVSVRRNNKHTLSGLPIKRIVSMVGNLLDWWPEPSEGSMGLDKFIGWAADSANPSEESSRGAQKPAWSGANSSPKHETEKDDCCICLQPMSSPKTDLSCSHAFHTECIRKWLSKESVCPICRKFTRMIDEFPTLK